jgi:hypothetical protein
MLSTPRARRRAVRQVAPVALRQIQMGVSAVDWAETPVAQLQTVQLIYEAYQQRAAYHG